MFRIIAAAIALAAGAPLHASAQDAPELPVVIDPQMLADIALAEYRGREMFRYDQAAWHATDALVEEIGTTQIDEPRGFLVVPRDGETTLDTLFLQERDGQTMSFARYTVDGTTVIDGEVYLDAPRPLPPLAAHMARTRGPALEAMAAAEFGICSDQAANTLVLPPDAAGNTAFYLLTPMQSWDSYPIGGHFRAELDPDLTVLETKRFMNTCFELPTKVEQAEGATDAKAAISFVRGDSPSEIHTFASHYFPEGFYVITTRNNMLWLVQGGRVTLLQENFNAK